MLRSVAPVSFALLTVVPSRVGAHHVDAHALGYAEPRSSLVVTSEHVTFELAPDRGRFIGTTIRVTRTEGAWALTTSLPIYSLVTQSDRAIGIGDVAFGAQRRIVGDGTSSGVWLGGTIELPVGDEKQRLASGHLELVPSIYAAWALSPSRTIVRAFVADAIAVDTRAHDHASAEHPGSLTAPHGDHELRTSTGLLHYLVPRAFTEIGLNAVTRWDARTGATLGFAHATVGVVPTPNWVLTCSVARPAFGEQRFEQRVAFSSQVLF